jgi:integrase
MTAMETDLPYLLRDRDRHGTIRFYVRIAGKKIRIREAKGTPAFARAYADAVEMLGARRKHAPGTVVEHPAGTFGWLGAKYFASKGEGGFLKLAKDSQRARRNSLEECFREPFSDTDPDPMGNCPLKYLLAQKIKRLLDAKADHPGAVANRRKHLSTLCAWGVENNHLSTNPVRDVRAGKGTKDGGYYTWVIPDVEQFIDHHRIGSKAVLALGLLLFTGARRQDMVTFGKQHVRGGWLRYVPLKTLYKRRTVSQKPWLPVLAEIVARSPCGSMTFLETAQGKPFTAAGFGNWFRARCDEAGLPQCSAHGLKKAGATIAAENGATTHQLMAMFNWTTVSMAEVYTKAAEQKRLAGEAMNLINMDRSGNENCPTDQSRDVPPAISTR